MIIYFCFSILKTSNSSHNSTFIPIANFIQHSIGHSTSFTSVGHCFNDSIFPVHKILLFLNTLALAFNSIFAPLGTTNHKITNFLSVKNIHQIFALHKTISISFKSSIPVIIFSILSVI
jgi:hypothetical protein